MGISDFDGKTFVAYIDISGFKKMMKDRRKALRVLDEFYRAGYTALRDQKDSNHKVEGIFVSDCGILFVRGQNPIDQLVALLSVVISLLSINFQLFCYLYRDFN